ncbi:hypothetical protein KI387_022049, partial [Taxus chinensis]
RSPPSASGPTSLVPSPIKEHLSPPSSPNIETISPLASPLREPLPTVLHQSMEDTYLPPPHIEEHPSSPPLAEELPSSPSPITDPVEIPLPLGEHSPSATQDHADLLSALLPTEDEASQFPVSKTHFTGISNKSSSIPPIDMPFSCFSDCLDY